MKQYPIHFIQLETNETIAYRKCGTDGPVVVLVHGNMSSSVHVQPLMEKLEKNYQVYALDLVGFGDSTYNRELQSLHDFSRDVTCFIETLNLNNVNLFGWSTGGGIVLETAADIAERINKLFLLDSVGIQGLPLYKKDASFKPILTERIYTREEISIDPVQVLPVLNAYQTNNRDLIRIIWDASIYNMNKPSDEDYEVYVDAIMKQRNLVDVDVALATFNMTHDNNGVIDGSGRIDLIKAPVVLIHGDKDLVVPLSDSKLTKSYFKDQAELVVLENVGHSALTDDLDLLSNVITSKIII